VPAAAKRTANISTVRATQAEKEKLRKVTKELGFSSLAHFFRHVMQTLLKQIALGQSLTWPLRFEEKDKSRKTP